MPASHSKANQRQTKVHKAGYTKYRNEFRREKSHIKRITKHLKRFPQDFVAKAALDAWKGKVKGYA